MAITALQPPGWASMEKEKEYLTLKDLIASETPITTFSRPIQFV
ncbi:MAG: hypothetical protein ACJ70O_08090 [Nitrososphaera sp.]